ncbi:hypothetical protein BsWGS_01759 [Bradybaena similaris]
MYSVRFNIVVAMPCMVEEPPDYKVPPSHQVNCSPRIPPVETNTSSGGKRQQMVSSGRRNWDPSVQAAVTGSFFWSYWITQVPGALLSTRYGGKKVFGWSTFACGLTTLLIPLAATVHYLVLIAMRLLLGLFQGVMWPAMFVIWSRWAPPMERQKLLTLSFSGTTFGIVFTYPTVEMLCNVDDHGWTYGFYLSGAATMMWCLLWKYHVYDTPGRHPRISKLEKFYILYSLKDVMPRGRRSEPPWKNILTSPAVWSFIFSHATFTLSFYVLMVYVKAYLSDVHYFSKSQATVTVIFLYIGYYLFGNISAAAYDAAIFRNLCSVSFARKVGNSVGFLVPSLLLIMLSFMDCKQSFLAVVTLMAINTMTSVQWGAGFFVSPAEFAPQHAGVIFGISNVFATWSGTVSLIVTKELTANRFRSGWQINFLLISCLFVIAGVMFIIVGTGEIEEWAKPSSIADRDKRNLSAPVEPLKNESQDLRHIGSNIFRYQFGNKPIKLADRPSRTSSNSGSWV